MKTVCATISVEKQVGLHHCASRLSFENSRHFFIQSEVKPEPIVIRSHTFSRASRQLHVIKSRFDWLITLSVFFVVWSE